MYSSTMPLSFPAEALQQLSALVRDIEPRAGQPRSLALASAVHEEGVSSAAFALANSLVRQHGLRVLLVDANLRAPSLHELCDLPRAPGLAELMNGGGAWQGAAHEVQGGLTVITAGVVVEHPSRLFAGSALQDQLTRLDGAVDWVLFDCPAVNVYPDAAAIAAACAATVLVVRSGRTRREIVQDAKRRLEQAGASVAGVVLNRRRYYIPEALYRWL